MEHSNRKLVTSILSGEAHLFGEIVRQFDDRVRETLQRRVRDPATIDDLVQQVFYKAFKQLDKVDDVEKLEGWLITIAKNCAIDHFRSTQSRNERKEDYGSQIEIYVREDEDTAWLWEEVEQLRAMYAEILLLRYQSGLSYQELSQHLNLPLSTIRGRLQDARKKLEERLTRKGLFP